MLVAWAALAAGKEHGAQDNRDDNGGEDPDNDASECANIDTAAPPAIISSTNIISRDAIAQVVWPAVIFRCEEAAGGSDICSGAFL